MEFWSKAKTIFVVHVSLEIWVQFLQPAKFRTNHAINFLNMSKANITQ